MPLTNFPNGTDQFFILTHTFGIDSAEVLAAVPVPFTGNVTGVRLVTGSVANCVAAYTVKIGSAGSTIVNAVSNAAAGKGVQEALTATTTAVTTAAGLVITRGDQGTDGDTTIGILLQRTA